MINKLLLHGPVSTIKYRLDYVVTVDEEAMNKLERITGFRKKLEYYNNNVQSLSILGMEGGIHLEGGVPERGIMLYSGSFGRRKLPGFSLHHEKIFFDLRAKEVKRLATVINGCQSYKEKLIALFNTPGFHPDRPLMAIYDNVPYDGTNDPSRSMLYSKPAIDIFPKDAAEIRTYNEFVTAEFEKMYLDIDGFTTNYCGFNHKLERQKLEKSLNNTIDQKLLVSSRIEEIETYFNYPACIHGDDLHPVLREIQLELGEPYTPKEYFAAKVMGEEIDLNQALLKTWSLAHYAHLSEIYKFYKYLIEYAYKDQETKANNAFPEAPVAVNNFDHIQMEKVVGHFTKELVLKGYLTDQELAQYIHFAFNKKEQPSDRFILKKLPTKQKAIGVFYEYYKTIAGKPHGRQLEYAALLGDYFEGFKTNNVSSNFNK